MQRAKGALALALRWALSSSVANAVASKAPEGVTALRNLVVFGEASKAAASKVGFIAHRWTRFPGQPERSPLRLSLVVLKALMAIKSSRWGARACSLIVAPVISLPMPELECLAHQDGIAQRQRTEIVKDGQVPWSCRCRVRPPPTPAWQVR